MENHINNPNHRLDMVYRLHPFVCDGCKTYGYGQRYRCTTCPNFKLHTLCAACPPAITTRFRRPNNITLTVARSPPPGWTFTCNICRARIEGMYYHCGNFHAHPLCAQSPPMVRGMPVHPHHSLWAVLDAAPIRCHACRTDCVGLRYRCYDGCGMDFHVECLLEVGSRPGGGGGRGGGRGGGGARNRRKRDIIIAVIHHTLMVENLIEFAITLLPFLL